MSAILHAHPSMVVRFQIVVLALLAANVTARPSHAGTLDQLVKSMETKVQLSLKNKELGRVDLALSVRARAGVVPELVSAVRTQLRSQLGSQPFRSVVLLAPGSSSKQLKARARLEGHELLADLELLIVEGYLHLRGNLVVTERHLWREIHRPHAKIASHLHARVRMDAEIRSYMGNTSAGAVRFAPRAFPIPGRQPVLALGIGDLDGDGRNELVLLRSRRIEVFRLQQRPAKFVRTYWTGVVPPVAQLRSRRPVGTMVVTDRDKNGRADLLVRTSEMKHGASFELVGRDLKRGQELAGYPLIVSQGKELLGKPLRGQDLFGGGNLSGAMTGVLPPNLRIWLAASTFYTLKTVAIAKRGGKAQHYFGMVDSSGQLRVFFGPQATLVATLPNVGIAFDLVDLDDDGTLEVVTTGAVDSRPEARDLVAMYRITSGAPPRRLQQRSDLVGLVTALTHGDLDGDGKQEVVGALQDEKGRIKLLVLN